MKYLKIGLLFLTTCVSQLIAQGETNYNKEDSTTFRQLKCGLWISNKAAKFSEDKIANALNAVYNELF